VREVVRFCTWQDILDLAVQISQPKPRRPALMAPPLPDLAPVENCSVRPQGLPQKKRLLADLDRFRADLLNGESPLAFPAAASQGLSDALGRALRPLIAWLEEASLAVASAAAARFQRDCFRQGILTFDDQIALCRNLLDDREILEGLRRRGYSVILDEAQDTSRMMFEILVEITRPAGETLGSWPGPGSGPPPGRFSMVGDPRQSIYERAAPRFYHVLNEAFRENDCGEILAFQSTKRCDASVVEMVNRTFRNAMIGENEIRYDDLLAEPTAGNGYVARIRVPGLDRDIKQVEKIFTEECRVLSEWLVERGKAALGIQFWNQVAIIAPRHEWLATCADQLHKQGLRYLYRNQRIAWNAVPAFSWPVALLYTLANPWDRFERLGVLREIFGVADTALATWIHDPNSASPELNSAVIILSTLASDLNGNQSITLGRLVDRIVSECRLETRLDAAGADPSGLDAIRRRAFVADLEGVTLHVWIEELLSLLDESADIHTAPQDAIELITSYSAKGMEWDIVIPIGFGRRIYTGLNTPYPQFVERGSVQRVIWNAESAGGNSGEVEDARNRRLLYVTLTRARHALLLPEIEYRDTRNSFRAASGFNLEEVAEVQTPLPPFTPAKDATGKQLELPIGLPDFSLAIQRSFQVPDLIRPHALAKDDERSESQFTGEPGDYHYGRWWHLWVERFPWQGTTGEQADYVHAVEPDLPFAERALRETANFLQSHDIVGIMSAGEWFRSEVSFSFPKTDTEWIEGVIDLVVGTRTKEVWLIDWKTNQKRGGEPDPQFAFELRQKYLPQLESYRSVIEQGFQKPVARLLIYSTLLARFV
jgi:ATP-dependent helicase/nuclease subunit A